MSALRAGGRLVPRRVRGVLKTALSWGAGWAIAGGLLRPLAPLPGELGLLGQGLVQDVVFSGFIGLFSGAVFGAGLALSEHRKRLDQVRVLETRIEGSSGYEGFDRAATAVAGIMGFTPAINRDTPVAVRVIFPVVFRVR